MATTQLIYGSLSANTLGAVLLSATTVSATTYLNLPNNVVGNYLPLSGGTLSGGTSFTNGLTANTISATTLTVNGVNITGDTYVTGLTFNSSNYNLTIGRNDGVSFTDSLSILASDLTVTGGTYNPNNGTATFTNNTGGTFTVTGFITGLTDTYVTGGTYSNGTATFTNTSGGTFNVTGFTQPFSGGSGNCITDLYVTNIHGCSPITFYDSIKSTGSTVSGLSSLSFGFQTSATTNYSHAEGYVTLASGSSSHAEGFYTIASGEYSHAEGQETKTIGNFSHVEGTFSQSIGLYSHAEGQSTTTIGDASHAEGTGTMSVGFASHAEGAGTISLGSASHAEGFFTIASGEYSHAEGIGTVTDGNYQHATGLWNATGDTTEGAFIIGNGIDADNRSNLLFAANSGVTVYGDFTANTISATTYQNLPTDVRVTGGTYSAGTITFTNNTGGTFNVTGLTTGSTTTVSGNFLPLSGGTVSGATNFTNGLSANTISATTYQNLPISGTHNYLSKFSSGSTILVDSQLRDDGSTVGLGIAPNVNAKLFVLTSSQIYGLAGQNKNTNGIGVFGQALALGNTTGVVGVANGTSTSNIGVYGQASEATTNIGLKGFAFNGTNNYSIQLQDGTEGIGKVLTSVTSDGKANWQTLPSTTFTGGTVSGSTTFTNGLTANTISATTYQNLPTDIRVTGSSYSNNTFTFTNNTGGTFNVLFNTVTGLTVNGNLTVTGTTSSDTISATTYLNLPVPTFFNPGTASTINWDVSGVSNNYTSTLTAATTINVSNIRNGEYATIILTQDSVGSRTITLGTINGTSGSGRHKVSSGGGGSIFLTSNPNAIDILSCVYDGNILYWTVGNDYT